MIQRKKEKILITGGRGFIGTNFLRYIFSQADFSGSVVNLDKMTYAANPSSWQPLVSDKYLMVEGDICDQKLVEDLFAKHQFDCVIHFAAESHVDRSIHGPAEFVDSNVRGIMTLLEACRKFWKPDGQNLFVHMSTDEVFGPTPEGVLFDEQACYAPRNPYAATKAAADHLVAAYFHTYQLPVIIANSTNNYGAFQHPEKLIPLMLLNMLQQKELPLYGDGKHERDWIFVEDACAAIWKLVQRGKVGERYNIGTGKTCKNIELVETLCEMVAAQTQQDVSVYKNLIRFISERKGHDRRYALNSSKIQVETSWNPTHSFMQGLEKTVAWYLANQDWLKLSQNQDYQLWLNKNY